MSDEPDAVRAAIKSTVEEWTAKLSHDWAGWATYFDEHAVLMVPGESRISGREAIDRFAHANFGELDTIGFEHWSIDVDGDLAVVNNDVIWRNAGDTEDNTAKQIVVLRRHDDARWIVHQVAYNSPGG